MLLILLPLAAQAKWKKTDPPPSLNGKRIQAPDSTGAYSFLTAGHLMGQGSDQWLLYPAGSFVANIDKINRSEASFFVGLGDVIRNSSDSLHVKTFREIFGRLAMPFFNAVGNHDVIVPEDWKKEFGETSYFFDYGGDRFFIIDLEDVSEENQKKTLDLLRNNIKGKHRHVFIFTHRVAFATVFPEVEILNARKNAPFTDLDLVEYFRELALIMRKGSWGHNVHWFAGDVGASWSYPAFYYVVPKDTMKYIAIGIGDTPLDQVLQVNVNPEGAVTCNLIPLSGQNIGPLEEQTIEKWEAYFKGKPPAELTGTGARIRRMLTNAPFWIGLGASLILFGGLFLYGRLRKRNDAT